ncbi:MAG: hypothetical protein ABH863_03910 [Candidatus Micrarchaeota archaeon]
MEILYSKAAESDISSMDRQLRGLFFKHIEKALSMPSRHMKFGMPFNVEEVTKSARLVFQKEGAALFIVRCFKDHKDYERWYKSFK